MFHVTLLICAYFKTVSYYFCVSGIESTRNWRITYLFYFCVEVFVFLKIFILGASLSLDLESRKNASLKDCLWEIKKPLRKNAYSTFCISVIPPMKINPQH